MLTGNTFQGVCNKIHVELTNKILKGVDISASKQAALIEYGEWFNYQEWRARAQASGVIDYEASCMMFGILGSSPSEFNAKDLSSKVATIMVMGSLAKVFFAGKGPEKTPTNAR